MKILRTPEHRFWYLQGYPFTAHYQEIEGLRIHYVDEGPADGYPILMLHGEPTWSYLYRKMIPVFVQAGFRAIAPDLPGFGKSDKPARIADYTYAAHVAWMTAFIKELQLEKITLIGQDWGSLIGLRLVGELPDRFRSVVIANGFLPTGETPLPLAFKIWKLFARWTPYFPVGKIVQSGCVKRLGREVIRAYKAPFPSEKFKKGARAFPRLVPVRADDPESIANQRAWTVLKNWRKPFLTVFGDRDPIFRGADRIMQKLIPGAAGQPHTILKEAGHFIQEDRGEELAEIVTKFLTS